MGKRQAELELLQDHRLLSGGEPETISSIFRDPNYYKNIINDIRKEDENLRANIFILSRYFWHILTEENTLSALNLNKRCGVISGIFEKILREYSCNDLGPTLVSEMLHAISGYMMKCSKSRRDKEIARCKEEEAFFVSKSISRSSEIQRKRSFIEANWHAYSTEHPNCYIGDLDGIIDEGRRYGCSGSLWDRQKVNFTISVAYGTQMLIGLNEKPSFRESSEFKNIVRGYILHQINRRNSGDIIPHGERADFIMYLAIYFRNTLSGREFLNKYNTIRKTRRSHNEWKLPPQDKEYIVNSYYYG